MSVARDAGVVSAIDRWNAVAPRGCGIVGPGAAEELIVAGEQRCGVAFPNSLRTFFAIANGWRDTGDPLGIAGLRRVEDLELFERAEGQWFSIWRDANGDTDDPTSAVLRRAIVLSVPGEAALLLDPLTLDPLTGEPLCFVFDNDTPGIAGPAEPFAAVLERLCDRLGPPGAATATSIEGDPKLAAAYRNLMAGDQSAFSTIERAVQRNWFAVSIWYQHLLLTREYRLPPHNPSLLWGGDVPSASLVDEPLIHEEILPLYAREAFDHDNMLERTIYYAPDTLAETLRRCQAVLQSGAGLTANFDYAPQFAAAIEQARALEPTDPGRAWQVILAALPHWQPRNDHHLAPLGLRVDKQLRRLLLHGTRYRQVPARAVELLAHPRAVHTR